MKVETKMNGLMGFVFFALMLMLGVIEWSFSKLISSDDIKILRNEQMLRMTEIKTEAVSTILLEPSNPETKKIFTQAQAKIKEDMDHLPAFQAESRQGKFKS